MTLRYVNTYGVPCRATGTLDPVTDASGFVGWLTTDGTLVPNASVIGWSR